MENEDFQKRGQQNCNIIHNNGHATDDSWGEDTMDTSLEKSRSYLDTGQPLPPKIQRRVYLCSACDTYFENWNLFLHMREVHQRHICLFCLGMFGQAERLSDHLMKKHNVPEMAFSGTEEFRQSFKGSCNLVCCACEKMFAETDDFYHHYCLLEPIRTMQSSGGRPFVPNESRRLSKRVIKPSRHINMDDVYQYSALTNRTKKVITKTGSSPIKQQAVEEMLEFKPDLSDSVSDTIMEVSKSAQDEVKEDIKDWKFNEDLKNLYNGQETEFKEKMEFDNFNTMTEDPKNEDDVRLPSESMDNYRPSESPIKLNDNSLSSNGKVKNEVVKRELCATPVPDRKLVIKICTKNNSMYCASSVSEEPQENQENSAVVNDNSDSESEHNSDHIEEEEQIEEISVPPEEDDGIILADKETTAILDLNIDHLLDSIDIQDLLRLCISAGYVSCVYCNHARHIAINGRQLSLHILAEHRYQPQHPAVVLEEDQFIVKLKQELQGLKSNFFNLDSFDTARGTYNPGTKVSYECFLCRFNATSHKDLYLHNRKLHQKIIVICSMCKTTFYSYSELLCHLCPGAYSSNAAPGEGVKFRCCFCPVSDLPSGFRLLVHLRRYHHCCETCLEVVGDQQRLAQHVWKHKLSHYCYRCGIGYRNKLDITNHLFWKHGTESSLCKKCLQKKWPHIYHFCQPSGNFECEECQATFTRAQALRVHKRIHRNEYPYSCSQCPEKLISKKLLAKHERSHQEPLAPPPVVKPPTPEPHIDVESTDSPEKMTQQKAEEIQMEVVEEAAPEKVIDALDLPPLNLSDSDSDSEDEKKPEQSKIEEEPNLEVSSEMVVEVERDEEEKKVEEQIMDGIWDNFKTYAATLEKEDPVNILATTEKMEIEETKEETESPEDEGEPEAKEEEVVRKVVSEEELTTIRKNVNHDHDYDIVKAHKPTTEPERAKEPSPVSVRTPSPKKKMKSPKKKKQDAGSSSSDSSSESDSSSCTCGSNCSCSSSSSSRSSSSSSSDSEDESSPRKKKKVEQEIPHTVTQEEPVPKPSPPSPSPVPELPPEPPRVIVRESDLETTESESDNEDFYDENPLQFGAKLLAEKRNKLMEETSLPNNGAVLPTTPEVPVKKKKTKSRRNRGGTKRRKQSLKIHIPKQPKPVNNQPKRKVSTPSTNHLNDSAASRASKRRRTVKKFFDDSSDEEDYYRQQMLKWRRHDTPSKNPMSNSTTIVENNSQEQQTAFDSHQQLLIQQYQQQQQQQQLLYQQQLLLQQQQQQQQQLLFQQQQQHQQLLMQQQQQQQTKESESIPEGNNSSSGSSSSDSENESTLTLLQQPPLKQRARNLYCYCQSVYDEVSEMIACDGDNCQIEWFHFDCVGIAVPPNGKWYCPDCQKAEGITMTNGLQ